MARSGAPLDGLLRPRSPPPTNGPRPTAGCLPFPFFGWAEGVILPISSCSRSVLTRPPGGFVGLGRFGGFGFEDPAGTLSPFGPFGGGLLFFGGFTGGLSTFGSFGGGLSSFGVSPGGLLPFGPFGGGLSPFGGFGGSFLSPSFGPFAGGGGSLSCCLEEPSGGCFGSPADFPKGLPPRCAPSTSSPPVVPFGPWICSEQPLLVVVDASARTSANELSPAPGSFPSRAFSNTSSALVTPNSMTFRYRLKLNSAPAAWAW